MKYLMINGKQIPMDRPEVIEEEGKTVVYNNGEQVGVFYRVRHWLIFERPTEEVKKIDEDLMELAAVAKITSQLASGLRQELRKRART